MQKLYKINIFDTDRILFC